MKRLSIARALSAAILFLALTGQGTNNPSGGGSGGGTVTSVTGGQGISCSPNPVTTSGTCSGTTPDNPQTSSYQVAGTDMGGFIALGGTGATLTIPAISATVFASGMSACYVNNGTGPWTISSTPTINGKATTSIQPGTSGCFVSNGTSLDWSGTQPAVWGTGCALPTTAVTRYCSLMGSITANATESAGQGPVVMAGTIARISIVVTAAPGTGNQHVFTLDVGGSAVSGANCTIATAATACQITTPSGLIPQDGLIDLKDVTTGTPSAATGFFTVAFYAQAD